MVEELTPGTLCSGMKSCKICFGGSEPTSIFMLIRFVITFRAVASNLSLSIVESKRMSLSVGIYIATFLSQKCWPRAPGQEWFTYPPFIVTPDLIQFLLLFQSSRCFIGLNGVTYEYQSVPCSRRSPSHVLLTERGRLLK